MLRLERGCPKVDVAACRGVPWERALERWVAWMDGLVRKSPPPALGLLWFETPSELNPAMTSVSGWTELGPASDSYGIEEERVWPIDKKGFTLPQGLHLVPEIDLAWKRMGLRDDADGAAHEDQLLAAVYALAYSCTLLLVINGLPRTRLATGLGAGSSIGVTMGWASGDFEAVGGFGGGKWSAMPRVRPPKSTHHDGPPTEKERFNVRKYFARGGNPHWRDPKTGENMLAYASMGDVADVQACIKAGVDVNAKDADGQPTLFRYRFNEIKPIRALLDAGADATATWRGHNILHYCGAASIPILELLVRSGANPRGLNHDGASVLDGVICDGRCTTRHLKFYEARGARVRKCLPLHRTAEKNCLSNRLEITRMLRYWLSRGFTIEKVDGKGRTPLWTALHEHAAELGEHVEWCGRNTYIGGTWDYEHDDTAVTLLGLGANPNQRLKKSTHPLIPDNATPLMVRRYDDDRLVRALLKHGADPHARCAKGKTALDYARQAARTPEKPGCTAAVKVAALLERAMKAHRPTKRR